MLPFVAEHPVFVWGCFFVLIALLLIGDFLLFQRACADITHKKALYLSGFWILIALIFNALLFWTHGKELALQFFAAYVVEESLSIDNLFVFLLIFQHFKIQEESQRKVLFWGILGAIFFRFACIFFGLQLLEAAPWVSYLMGAFICYTGVKLLRRQEVKTDFKRNWFVRAFSFFPLARQADAPNFFIRENNQLKVTLLFLVLMLVESTDLIFALDSIPAVLAITRDSFIAYSSNLFAVLGLRAIYFALRGLLSKLKYLHYGLCAILIFIGVKMFLAEIYPIPLYFSLLFIVVVLGSTALLSVTALKKSSSK